jgi:DNA-binding response OmpR family regulator
VSVFLAQHTDAQAQSLAALLEGAGFRVTVGMEPSALAPIDPAAFDVVVVGTGALLGDRLELCRRLRSQRYLGAIVALSARAADVPALVDAGADDFVVTPIQADELVMRLRLALSRVVARSRSRWGPFEIDRVHRSVTLHGHALQLTSMEYALLSCLLDAAGSTVSRGELLLKVWGRDGDTGSNLVEVHLSRLRDKLGVDAWLLETVRGAGYRLKTQRIEP